MKISSGMKKEPVCDYLHNSFDGEDNEKSVLEMFLGTKKYHNPSQISFLLHFLILRTRNNEHFLFFFFNFINLLTPPPGSCGQNGGGWHTGLAAFFHLTKDFAKVFS